MNAIEINQVEQLLHGLIHRALFVSSKLVIDNCQFLKTKIEEPDFIASLTLNFSNDLFNILKAIFPKSKLSITGIYCHQKPLVDIGLNSDPELGDLLFVYIHTDRYGDKKLNSVIFQAKITSSHQTRIPSSDAHQLRLYSQWPEFTYKRAGSLNGIKRNIQPKTINDGGQYLLIDTHPIFGLSGRPGTFTFGCATPSKILNLDNDLATEIVQFLKFKSGRTFEEKESSHDDWTKMIWDVIKISKKKASKRKNSGFNGFQRQVTKDFDGCCFCQVETNSIFRDLYLTLSESNSDVTNNSIEEFISDDDFSLSIIVIESTEENA